MLPQMSLTQSQLDSYRLHMNLSFCLTLMANSYGIYMIFWKSPKKMAIYRWYLLNILIWAFLLDFMFAFFYQPYPLFPILGACSLGKINWFTANLFWNDYFMFLITTELVGSCAISILAAIFYRVLVLYNAGSWLRRLNSTIGRSMIAMTTIVIYGLVTVILAEVLAMLDANLGMAMQELKMTNPELFTLLSTQHCFIAQIDDQFRVVLLLATVCLFAAMLVTVGLVCAALLALWLRRHSLSANAHRMHTQFIRALIFQVNIGTEHPIQIPFTLINGHNNHGHGNEQQPKTLTIWAGVHGGEFVGLRALSMLAEQLEPAQLRGRLILCLVANPPAVFQGRMNVSPLDGINLNRVFPGKADGQPTERLAKWLFDNTLPTADYFIDLHSGGIDQVLSDFVAYRTGCAKPGVDAQAKELAMALSNGGDVVVGHGVADGNSHAACARQFRIPSILVETGELGQRDFASANGLKERLLKALVHLELLNSNNVAQIIATNSESVKPREWQWIYSINASHRGFWFPEFNGGDEVEADQLLGRIIDPVNGALLEEIKAKKAGRIFYAQHGLPVEAGTILVEIAARVG